MKNDKILIYGGRDYADWEGAFKALDLLKSRIEQRGDRIAEVIEGGAKGADRLGREWAQAHGISVITFNADWNRFGKSAGSIRNRQQFEEGQPNLCVEFPGGPGTRNMRSILTENGVTPWCPFGDPQKPKNEFRGAEPVKINPPASESSNQTTLGF